MKEHINVLQLDDSVLKHLATNKESIETLTGEIFTQESKDLFRHGGGYFINQVIFYSNNENEEENKLYFRFLEISYLDDQVTYTKPYEVFKETETRTITRFSNWIESEDEDTY